MRPETNRRILVVDDNPSIHADFRKILASDAGAAAADVDSLADALFGGSTDAARGESYEIESAFQGEEALAKLERARREDRPFSMAFIDVRMPPGWDGITTLSRLWQVDPDLQAVICTAFSDYSYEQMLGKLGRSQNLLILKKPFDPVEVQQLASALTQKWSVTLSERLYLEEIRSYSASLETVNRALQQDKAMAQSFAASRAALALGASAALARLAGQASGALDVTRSALEGCGHVGLLLEAGFADRKEGRALVDLGACVEDARGAAALVGVELTVQCAASVPQSVDGDPDLLRSFLGLLVSAAAACRASRIDLAIAHGLDMRGEQLLDFSARVSGPALDVGLVELSAEPDLARSSGALPLAAARALARLAGADCSVEATGSSIVVRLQTGACASGGGGTLDQRLSDRRAA